MTVIRRLESAVVGRSDVCKGWSHKQERGENCGKFLLDVCDHGGSWNFCIYLLMYFGPAWGGGIENIFNLKIRGPEVLVI